MCPCRDGAGKHIGVRIVPWAVAVRNLGAHRPIVTRHPARPDGRHDSRLRPLADTSGVGDGGRQQQQCGREPPPPAMPMIRIRLIANDLLWRLCRLFPYDAHGPSGLSSRITLLAASLKFLLARCLCRYRRRSRGTPPRACYAEVVASVVAVDPGEGQCGTTSGRPAVMTTQEQAWARGQET
jgi:hypothetical protein